MIGNVERPRNCGECARFMRRKNKPGHGWCDNWAGVDLTESDVCHPNFGVKKNPPKKEGAK